MKAYNQRCGGLFRYAPPRSACTGRKAPLVIMAGEGKTGTSSITIALVELGFSVGHFYDHLCPREPLHAGAARRRARESCENSSKAWKQAHKLMMHTPPSQYHAVDWCAALRHVGAIGDVPVPEIFPFLFAQHSDARVVLTVRNSVDWFSRRAGWGRSGRAKTGANWSDPAPLGWVSWESAAQAYITAKPTSSGARPTQNVDEFMRHLGGTASAWAYFAQLTLVACLVPAEQLLIFDLFNGNATDAERWSRLGRLLQLWVPPNPGKFPRIVPDHGRGGRSSS